MARPVRNISEPLVALLVQPRVQPTQRGLTRLVQSIVDEGEDAGGEWAGSGRSGDGDLGAVPERGEV